jgi:signal transduction histidine kinase
MLEEFIRSNRDTIIARTRARVAVRFPSASGAELVNGIPVFLDQLGVALRLSKQGSGAVDHSEIGLSASRHGNDLRLEGMTIGQVVHEYGDVCQTITELAMERKAALSSKDFKTLNLCLDDAIAGAVTEYSAQREHTIEREGTERLGTLAHELRSALNTAMLAFESIKTGRVAPGGATGVVLTKSLLSLRDVIDRSLAAVRLDVGLGRLERLSVNELIQGVEIGAMIQAEARGVQFLCKSGDLDVTIEGDHEILASAISNLLENAFKFTRAHGKVTLTTHADDARVLIDIEDECGGLPAGKTEDLFRAFEQRGDDRSGLGLGLAICVKGAKASGGHVRVRDLPGKGCVFTIELPRRPLTTPAV